MATRYGSTIATMKCTADSNYMCGGSLINSLYIISHLSAPTAEPTESTGSSSSSNLESSSEPISEPTSEPTFVPTFSPSSQEPTTLIPSTEPTLPPSYEPTLPPSYEPTYEPTVNPSNDPTATPSFNPTSLPTLSSTIPKPSLVYLGDYYDGGANRPRALQKRFPGATYTPESCYALSATYGYSIIGLQYGGECW